MVKCPHPRSSVHEDEIISRFIFEEKWLRNKSQAAFSPPNDLKFSTYRITRLNDHSVWEVGNKYVAEPRKLSLLGRADLQAKEYLSRKLSFEPNGIPHTRHTDVVGWNPTKPDDHARRCELALAATWLSIT